MSSSRRASWVRSIGVGALAAVPVAIDWFVRVVSNPRPFWAYWCDPEAMYFFSSLELLRGQAPIDIDNPGTPVQAFGALLAWMVGGGPEGFETFLSFGYAAILIATFLGCALLVRRFLSDVGVAGLIGLVWLYFLCPQALARAVVWAAEPFQFLGGVVLLVTLDRMLRKPGRSRRIFGAGVATGLLIGLKFTFLGFVPALLVGVLAADRAGLIRRWATALAGVLLGFVVATIPAAVHWPRMIQRIVGVATSDGSPVWADASSAPAYVDNLLLPFASGTVWYGLFALVAVGWVAMVVVRRRSGDPMARADFALGAFGLTAFVLTHLAAARAPYLRYHLPNAVAAMALLLALLRAVALPRRRWVSIAATVLIGAGLARQIHMNLGWHDRLIVEHRELRALAEHIFFEHDNRKEVVVLYGGRFPHPALALYLFSRTPEEERAIGRLHPQAGLYDRRGQRIVLPGKRSWDYLVLEEHDLKTFPEPYGRIIRTIGRGNETSSTYHIVSR